MVRAVAVVQALHQSTLELATKRDPLTVTVRSELPPVVPLAGLIAVMTGGPTVKETALEATVPFLTAICAVPATEPIRDALRLTAIDVELAAVGVTVEADPLTGVNSTVELVRKLVPVMVTVVAELPAPTPVGSIVDITGPTTVKVMGFDDAPPGSSTVICAPESTAESTVVVAVAVS